MRYGLPLAVTAWLALVAVPGLAQTSNEDVARRQLESGRAFALQGNYAEALADFRAVAETHAATSVADDAWLELARYYFDIVGDAAQTEAAVNAILERYATSDSAPDAYVMAGRLAMGRGHEAEHLDAALANFDRVARLFPTAPAVPRSLQLAAEVHYHAGRLDAALAGVNRVTSEYPADIAAPDAYVLSGRVLLAMGHPILAMEELQQVRNRWPGSLPARDALAKITLLHRLYIRAPRGPAYMSSGETVGPERVQNVRAVVATAAGPIYYASERGIGIVTPADAESPPSVGRPRGAAREAAGTMAVIDDGRVLRPSDGGPLLFRATQSNGDMRELDSLDAVAQLANGDWLVMDGDQQNIHRFASDATYLGPFPQGRVRRLAVSVSDVVAGIERNRRAVLVFDNVGQSAGQIELRTDAYDLRDAEDLTFDSLGHLYVLVEDRIGIFSPFPAAAGAPAGPSVGAGYRLLTIFSVPDGAVGRFDRARAFALDASGVVYLFDDRARRFLVYR
jgi:outer membrane protein assembly factor BamD (BamD/ComL family)